MARPRKLDDGAVLDRATDLFWRQGVGAVSIRDLEVELDLKAPSIYRRFSSKNELLARCIDRYVERAVGGRIRHFLDDADDPLDGLRAFFTSSLLAHPGEQRPRGCLLTTTSGHAEALSPDVRGALDRGFRTVESAFCRQIERAKTAGRLAPDIDSEATAAALLLSFQGLLVLARNETTGLAASIEATFNALVPTG